MSLVTTLPAPNERPLADCHVRQNGHVDTYPTSLLEDWPLHALGADWVRVVCSHDSGCEEDIVFDRCQLGDIDVVVNLDATADLASIVDGRVIPDTEVVANHILFADDHIMPGFEVRPNLSVRVNHRVGADMSVIADASRRDFDIASAAIAQNHTLVTMAVLTQIHQLSFDHL